MNGLQTVSGNNEGYIWGRLNSTAQCIPVFIWRAFGVDWKALWDGVLGGLADRGAVLEEALRREEERGFMEWVEEHGGSGALRGWRGRVMVRRMGRREGRSRW